MIKKLLFLCFVPFLISCYKPETSDVVESNYITNNTVTNTIAINKDKY